MNLIKQITAIFCSIFLFLSTLQSQTFEDFKKQVKQDYDKFEQSTLKKFDDYVVEIDKEFTDYLLESFGPYVTEQFKQTATTPKPETLPNVVDSNEDLIQNIIEYTFPKEVYLVRQGPMLPNISKTETVDFLTDSVNVEFLGWPLFFKSDTKIKTTILHALSAEGISNYWTDLSDANYNHLLYQLNNVKDILNLNDWGYFQLIKLYTQHILPENENMQVMLQWVLLSRSRYKVKIAFTDDRTFLLLPTIFPLYAKDFLRFDGLEYYVIDGSAKDLNTYAVDFPEADIIMDLRISKPFYTQQNTTTIKTYNFNYEGEKLSVQLKIDPIMIDFYKTVPLSDVSVYFNSTISELTKESIIEAFTPLIKGKSQVDAADLLLHFVQQAFDYKTDQQVFGQEQYFFADEVLHYPYSDCEDRSVLYAYLVKTLLKTNVLGIGYPGHMATVVNFADKPEGYFLRFNNKDYVAADPTYHGASIGMLLPSIRNQKAEIILTDNKADKSEQIAKIWEIVRKGGGSKADLLNDVVFDDIGNAFVCGYFTRQVKLSDLTVQSDNVGREVFLAKFDDQLRPLWINKASGPGNDLAFSLTLNKNGNLYMYGSVEEELNFGNVIIEAEGAPDVFVAMYNKDGQLQWAKKAGIDKLDHSANFMFAAKFNSEGKKIMAKLYSETENFEHYGLRTDVKDNAVITGSFYATPGMNSNDYKNYEVLETLDKPEALKETNDDLIELKYEKTIAGLFAALNLIKFNNYELKGDQIQSVFDKYNNNFISSAGKFYSNFGEMTFLKNKGGIIIIKTKTGDPLYFNMIKLEDEARIKIIKYKSGNMAVQIYSGISVGNDKKSMPMNSIKLFKENGDVLFDYGDDNSTKKLNLKTEILKQ